MPSSLLRPARPTTVRSATRTGPGPARRPAARRWGARLAAAAAVLGAAGLAAAGAPGPAGAAVPVATWTTATPASSPPPLAYAAAAYDADTSSVVLFGGMAADGTLSAATWIWNGTTWSRAATPQSPPARELASMAFDPVLHQLILFGGQGDDGTLLGDTWAWNGATWVRVASGGTAPSTREAAAFAFDPGGNLLLFGGTGYSNGASPPSTTTTLPAAGVAPPSPRAQIPLGDTWEWTASGWVHSPATGPAARSGAALAYDPARGATVMFGGEATSTATPVSKPLADTWVWGRSGWAQAKPAASPPARFEAVADGFAPFGGPLLLAGEGSSGTLADGWVWDGTTWSAVSIQGSAAPRAGAAGAYDSATREMVVFGGRGGGGATLGDTGLVRASLPGAPTTTVVPAPTTTVPVPARRPVTTTPRSTPPAIRPAKPGGASPTSVAHPRATVPPLPVAAAGGPVIQVSRRTVPRGGSVQLTGAGFAPGSTVVVTFHSAPARLATLTVGPSGTFSASIGVPRAASAGMHQIVASGTAASGSPARLAAAVMVEVPHHSGLSTIATLALVGLALLIPVAAYLAMAAAGVLRRRRASRPARG